MAKYPIVIAAVCLLFICFGLAAVIEPTPQVLATKITTTAALAIPTIILAARTSPDHSIGLRRLTWFCMAAAICLIPLVWIVR